MGKPHLLGLLVLLLAGCTAVPSTGSDPEAGMPEPDVNEVQPEALPTEPAAAAPVPEQLPIVELEDYGPAPELTNEVWLNTAGPLRLAELRGQVVLLDMWTFG